MTRRRQSYTGYTCRDGTFAEGSLETMRVPKGGRATLGPPCRLCGNPSPLWYCPACTNGGLRVGNWPAPHPPGYNAEKPAPCHTCGNPGKMLGHPCPVCRAIHAETATPIVNGYLKPTVDTPATWAKWQEMWFAACERAVEIEEAV